MTRHDDQQPPELSPLEAARQFELQLSQKTAAKVDCVEAIGGVTLLTCLINEETPSQLNELSGVQYKVLRLISQGFTNRQISGELGTTPGTVKNYISGFASSRKLPGQPGIFEILGAVDRYAAARYIPVDERRLRSICLKEAAVQRSPDGKTTVKVVDKLSVRELRILDYFVSGESVEQISDRYEISSNTAHHIIARMRRKLGIDSLSEMVRYAAALKTLERYEFEIQEIAELVVPAAREVMPKIKVKYGRNARQLYRITVKMLREQPDLQQVLNDKRSRRIAREVIRQEAAAFIRMSK